MVSRERHSSLPPSSPPSPISVDLGDPDDEDPFGFMIAERRLNILKAKATLKFQKGQEITRTCTGPGIYFVGDLKTPASPVGKKQQSSRTSNATTSSRERVQTERGLETKACSPFEMDQALPSGKASGGVREEDRILRHSSRALRQENMMEGEANSDTTETPIQVPNAPVRRLTNAKSGASKHKTCRVRKHRRNRSTKASETSESFVLDGEEHEVWISIFLFSQLLTVT